MSRSLVSLSEAQRSLALERFHIICPFLEDGVPLPRIAQEQHQSLRTLRRWVQHYRVVGLAGLVRAPRADQGQRRVIPLRMQRLIEGLALQKPRRTIAVIHREVQRIAHEQHWCVPSYSTIERIVHQLDPALLTYAHEGAKA